MDTTTRQKFHTSQFKIKIPLHNSRKEQQKKRIKAKKKRAKKHGETDCTERMRKNRKKK